MYDLVIIGGGPAGVAAAIYSVRYMLKIVVITKIIGGQILEAAKIENWPGIKSISGIELAKKFKEHLNELKVEIKEAEVVDVKKEKNTFIVVTSDNKRYEAKSLLLALGKERRNLGIKAEEQYIGRGISRCAICDGPLFKDKIIGIIGSGNITAKEALLLSEYGKKVYVICKGADLEAEPLVTEQIKKNKKIEIIKESSVTDIKGDKFVKGIILNNKKSIALDGLFISEGATPSVIIAEKLGVKLDKNNFIIVDQAQATNIPGVFAAGDVTSGSNKLFQILTAAAEGALAATSAYKFCKK